MSASGEPKSCPDCGASFTCGMGSDKPCWCSTDHAAVMPVPDAGADCYCANCLQKRIESARQRANAKA